MKYLKFSILFIALMAQVGAVLGQSVVSEIPEHKADTTIVTILARPSYQF